MIEDPQNPNEIFKPVPGIHKDWFSSHHVLGFVLLGVPFIAVVAWLYFMMQIGSSVDISPVQHQAKKDQTVNWKVYSNNEYGFEFKYPDGWAVEVSGSDLHLDSAIAISGKLEYEKYVKEQHDKGSNDCCPPYWDFKFSVKKSYPDKEDMVVNDEKGFTANNLKFIQYDEIGTLYGGSHYATEYQNKIYDFEIINGSENDLIQILSTFKFIESIPADWKVYTNIKYGFEFKYPSDWIPLFDPEGISFQEKGVNYEKEIPLPLIISFNNTNFIDLKTWFENEYSDRSIDDKPAKKEVSIGNLPALEIDDPISIGGVFYDYVVITNHLLIKLQFSNEEKVANKILSTFKFTN
jgi:hypothetical protein